MSSSRAADRLVDYKVFKEVHLIVIEPILVMNRVRARSSWLGLGAEPSADRSPNRCHIVWMHCKSKAIATSDLYSVECMCERNCVEHICSLSPVSHRAGRGCCGRETSGDWKETCNDDRPDPVALRQVQDAAVDRIARHQSLPGRPASAAEWNGEHKRDRWTSQRVCRDQWTATILGRWARRLLVRFDSAVATG